MNKKSCIPELQQILKPLIIELMDCGGTDAFWAADSACADYPDLESKYGRAEIQKQAQIVLDSEVPELARDYQNMFHEANARYFGGHVPGYKVRIVYAIDYGGINDQGGYDPPSMGKIDNPGKEIRLRLSADRNAMYATMLHEMAHASTGNGGHGQDWLEEMRRLNRIGAPVLSCDVED